MVGQGIGGFVHCLISAKTQKQAIEKLKRSLYEKNYELVVMESIIPYKDHKFKNAADRREHDKFARQASETDEVVYGVFYTWEREE